MFSFFATFCLRQCLVGALALTLAGLASGQVSTVDRIADLERQNRILQTRITTLNADLQKALEEKAARTERLREMREHLALFGKDLFSGGDSKLRQAVADYQVIRERMQGVELTADALLQSLDSYLATAVAADPEARAVVEARLREFEQALGHREQPQNRSEKGTINVARVVTVHSESGLLVLNAGKEAGLRPGMRYRIERSGTHLGDATVAITRPNVSGLLMQNLTKPGHVVRSGDAAHVILD